MDRLKVFVLGTKHDFFNWLLKRSAKYLHVILDNVKQSKNQKKIVLIFFRQPETNTDRP